MVSFIQRAVFSLCLSVTTSVFAAAPAWADESADTAAGTAPSTENPQAQAAVSAIAEAQASLPAFWEQYETRQTTGASLFAVKVGFMTNAGSTEQVWVTDLARQGERYFGILGNDPKDIAGVDAAGEPVTFRAGDITDWGYADGQRLRGHFTTRAQLTLMSPVEAEHVRSLLHDDPLPAGASN